MIELPIEETANARLPLRRYPQLEKTFAGLLSELMNFLAEANHPLLSQVSKVPMEIRELVLERSDGSKERIEPKAHAVPFELKRQVFENLDLDELWAGLADAGDAMGRLMMQSLFEKVREATEKTGNVVKTGGVPLDCNHLVEMYEKVEIMFTQEGTPKLPTLVLHPDMMPRLHAILSDPECERRIAAVIERKRRAFLAKRSNR